MSTKFRSREADEPGQSKGWSPSLLLSRSIENESRRTLRVFVVMFIAALMLNAAAYLLNLWHEQTPFDEVTHLYTTFAAVGLFGALAPKSRVFLVRSAKRHLLLTGFLLGCAWEVFEGVIGIIGGPADTATDLVMDTLGAGLAIILLRRMRG